MVEARSAGFLSVLMSHYLEEPPRLRRKAGKAQQAHSWQKARLQSCLSKRSERRFRSCIYMFHLILRGGFALLAKLRGDVDGRRGVRVDDRDTGEWTLEPEMFKGPVALTVKI